MNIFVDADSCPVRIREIICNAGNRIKCNVIFAANRAIPLKKNEFVVMVVTGQEDQAADNYIVQNAKKGDLVVTRDIPLAKKLVDMEITVINDRGEAFTSENINSILSLRNFMYELQANGLSPDKTGVFGKKEIQRFANRLDAELSRLTRHFYKPLV